MDKSVNNQYCFIYELGEIDLILNRQGKIGHAAFTIKFLAVEPTIDGILQAAAQGIEQTGDRQSGYHHGNRRTLPGQAGESLLH